MSVGANPKHTLSYARINNADHLPLPTTAAPLVAGMVAYWLGHPDYTGAFPASQVAQAAKDSVTALHWPRVEGGYDVVYNGAHECVEEDGGSSSDGGEGSTASARRGVSLEGRQDSGNATLGLGGILAASCPLPPSSSSSSSVITAAPTTFATVTSTAAATSTAAVVEPMYCYSFDPACYVSLIPTLPLVSPSIASNSSLTFGCFFSSQGYCCPDEPGGTCSSGYPGKQGCRCGAGGATNVLPDGAQCPMPA